MIQEHVGRRHAVGPRYSRKRFWVDTRLHSAGIRTEMGKKFIRILKASGLYPLARAIYQPLLWSSTGIRDTVGGIRGRRGAKLAKTSRNAHLDYTKNLLRGPYRGWIADALIEHAEALEKGADAVEVMQSVVSDLGEALLCGEFDRWIDQPVHNDAKRTLVKCESYLPGRRWKLQLFFIPDGHSHPPHCHDDVASCLMIAKGTIRAREYDRRRDLEISDDTAILELSSDRLLEAGGCLITSSDYRNVHWFGAVGGPAIAFNFQAVGFLNGKRPSTAIRKYVDPVRYERPTHFPAPRLDMRKAYVLFQHRSMETYSCTKSLPPKRPDID